MAEPGVFASPSPELFFDTINAYQRTAVLRSAIELDVFTAIGAGIETAPEIARQSQSSERGIRILCDYLTIIGFLIKEDGHYRLTPDSAMFLDRRSSSFIGGSIEFLLSPMLMDAFKDLTPSVRKGGATFSPEGTLASEHPIWVKFARAMAPLTTIPAQALASLFAADPQAKLKVLDIAAGHGTFGITFARNHPQAMVVAVDWPNVLEVAKENARAAGISERYRTIAGSAFDVDYGSCYDVVLLTNFLHHFDSETCEKLLRKVHGALGSGGRAMTLEFVPNEDRVSPAIAAGFSMVMLASTPSGDAYTFAEFDRMFRNAGFTRTDLKPLHPAFQQVLISYK